MNDDARINVQASEADADFSLTVKRNCSISPRVLLWLLAATALLSFGIGVGFALFGAWLILPFAGIEMVALAVAFYVNGRHAGDYERIALHEGMLSVEVRDANDVHVYRFNPHWVRLVMREGANARQVALVAHGKELEIGRHLDAPGRKLLAAELGSRLGRIRR